MKIARGLYKFSMNSNVYFLDKLSLVIDTGNPLNKELLKQEFSKVADPKSVKKVIFTHFHYDHIGNYDLFENAKFYASKEEIEDWKKNPSSAILSNGLANTFKPEIIPLESMDGFEILSTPGHTRGSICLLYNKILFSGDTIFKDGYGRTDLPTSVPEELTKSVEKLRDLNYDILCSGHDY